MDFAIFEKVATNKCSEEGVIARFYDRVVKTDKIGENGLPQFRLVCFCEIRIKDNTSEIYDQPATEEKIRRFPNEYARYQLAKKQVVDGTPLDQFAFLDRAEIETLKIHGIYTVEALSAIDTLKARQLGLEEEKNIAEKFLQQAKNNKAVKEWQKKEEEYQNKIKLLEEKLEVLNKLQAEINNKSKKGRKTK